MFTEEVTYADGVHTVCAYCKDILDQAPQMSHTTFCTYLPGAPYDWLLFQWWAALEKEGSLYGMLLDNLHTPLAFSTYFAYPGRLLFCVDDQGIWFALWHEPMLSGGAIGCWTRPAKRITKDALECFLRGMEQLYKQYPVLVSVTKQPRVAHILESLGFSWLGNIPQLFQNECAHVYYMTKEGFAYGIGNRQERRYRRRARRERVPTRTQ